MSKQKIEWKKAVERRHPPIFMDFLIQGQFRKYIKEITGLDAAFNVKKCLIQMKKSWGENGLALFISIALE